MMRSEEEEATEERRRRRQRDAEPKTKPPHNDVGKNKSFCTRPLSKT